MRCPIARWAPVCVAALLLAPSAFALSQPDGTVIPVVNGSVTTCSDNSIQACLNAEEGGNTINALTAAAVTPETFNPLCGLTFKVIARGAGYYNTFGWYNVNPNGKPPNSDLHAFLQCSDGPGTSKVLNIKNDPGYLGGQIGFFMASPEGTSTNCPQFNPGGGPISGTVGYIYYSERKYNPDNQGANSFIHLLIYDSVTFKDSFYFGWEDLLSGGDNDFDDLLTRVEGITCTGGGAGCDTKKPGKCAKGTMQCVGGALTCVQAQQPTQETCNALDDDCDGEVDNGDLCPQNQVCDRGKCVPKCGSGEFACKIGLICSAKGLCVDPKCETVTCPAGQICIEGACQAPCGGVKCPYGQECVEGVCTDPCDGLTCDDNYVCDLGVCKLKCSCAGCEGTLVCDSTSQLCVEPGCSPNPCQASAHCSAGQCIDNCQGVTCPKGQVCSSGECAVDPNGGTGGTAGNGGATLSDAGPTGGLGGGANASGAGGGLGGMPSKGSVVEADDSGCGCRLTGRRSPREALLLLLGACLGLLCRRRHTAR